MSQRIFLKTTLLTLSLLASFSAFAGIEVLSKDDLTSPARANDLKAVELLLSKSTASLEETRCNGTTPSDQWNKEVYDMLLNGFTEPAISKTTMFPKLAICKDDATQEVIGFMIYTLFNQDDILPGGIIIFREVDERYRETNYDIALLDHALAEFKQAHCYMVVAGALEDQTPYTTFLINLLIEKGFTLKAGQACLYQGPDSNEEYDKLEGPVYFDKELNQYYKIDGPRHYVFESTCSRTTLCAQVAKATMVKYRHKIIGGAALAAIGTWLWYGGAQYLLALAKTK